MTVGLSLGVEELAYGASWLVRDLGGKALCQRYPTQCSQLLRISLVAIHTSLRILMGSKTVQAGPGS